MGYSLIGPELPTRANIFTFFFFKARFNLSKKLQQRGKIDQLALVENALVLTLFGYTKTSEIFLFYSTFTFCTVYLQYHNYFRKVITLNENNPGETEWEKSSQHGEPNGRKVANMAANAF